MSTSASRIAAFPLALALTALASFGTAPALAQTADALTVSTITTYPPFAFKDAASNKLVGFEIDLMEAVGAKLGRKINWVEASFAQLTSFNALTTKRSDVIVAGMADTPDKHDRVVIVDYVYDPMVVYTLRPQAAQYTGNDSFCGKRMGYTRSSFAQTAAVRKLNEDFCEKNGKPPIVEASNDGASFSRLNLNQGRLDLAVNGASALVFQNGLEDNRYVTVGEPILKPMYGMVVAKDNTALSEALKRGVAQVMADGTYEQVLKKWNMPVGARMAQPMVNGQP